MLLHWVIIHLGAPECARCCLITSHQQQHLPPICCSFQLFVSFLQQFFHLNLPIGQEVGRKS
jgi:hypothetical protein